MVWPLPAKSGRCDDSRVSSLGLHRTPLHCQCASYEWSRTYYHDPGALTLRVSLSYGYQPLRQLRCHQRRIHRVGCAECRRIGSLGDEADEGDDRNKLDLPCVYTHPNISFHGTFLAPLNYQLPRHARQTRLVLVFHSFPAVGSDFSLLHLSSGRGRTPHRGPVLPVRTRECWMRLASLAGTRSPSIGPPMYSLMVTIARWRFFRIDSHVLSNKDARESVEDWIDGRSVTEVGWCFEPGQGRLHVDK